MKALFLLGGSGFVGSHLRIAAQSAFSVVALGRATVDIRSMAQLRALFSQERPDYVINLAAITTLQESFASPRDTYETTFFGTLNLLTALAECDFSGRMLYVSSSEVYGALDEEDLPVRETMRLRPSSPYAVAKIAGEALCYQWSQSAQFRIITARPFNHIGPGQRERFAIADFGRQIAAIKLGLSPPVLHVGDIDTTRDFIDVRDVSAAYLQLLEKGRNGEAYNVCSGTEFSIRSLVHRMCAIAGVTVELRPDPTRIRPHDQPRVRGCTEKLFAETGWTPRYTLDESLSDILDYWSQNLKQYSTSS